MIAPYDHTALWLKAKVFLNRAMDPDSGRSFDEQALWASAALELLAKSALARVSPLLIAEPSEDGKNILIATGLLDGEARFWSVAAKTIFARCARAFHPFNGDEALKIAHARNEYLHGSGVPFMNLPSRLWWPRYWALVSTLIDAQDRTIEELVGDDRVSKVQVYLEQNTKYVEDRTASLISRARQRLAQHKAGNLPLKVAREWQSNPSLTVGLRYSQQATCPACGHDGTLEGEDSSDMDYEYDYDEDGEVFGLWATVHVPPDYFSCDNCHLVLDGYEFIVQAGLREVFDVVDENAYPEPEYGND